jgi:hypothetical protein
MKENKLAAKFGLEKPPRVREWGQFSWVMHWPDGRWLFRVHGYGLTWVPFGKPRLRVLRPGAD